MIEKGRSNTTTRGLNAWFLPLAALIASLLFIASGCSSDDESPTGSNGGGSTPSDTVFYSDLRLTFNNSCGSTSCHGGSSPQKGLTMTTYAGILAGSINGAVVIPGNSAGSELYLRVTGARTPSMPFGQSLLPLSTRDLIKEWIDDGALE